MVLYGTVHVDVYARGGSDAENLCSPASDPDPSILDLLPGTSGRSRR
jgi:hypothetical protein